MKLTKTLVIILSIVFCVGGAVAWYASQWQGSVTMSVKPEKVTDGEILVSSSMMADGTKNCVISTSKTIKCLHSSDGVTFCDQDENSSTEYTQVNLYLTCEDNLSSFWVSNVSVSDDTLKGALRMAIISGKNVVMYDPDTGAFPTTSLGSLTKSSTVLPVRIWYEGDDVDCTTDNASASAGSEITITFDGVE